MQCGFLAFRDLNGHLCPMLITLESPGPSELGGWQGARTPSDISRSVMLKGALYVEIGFYMDIS